MTCEAEVVVLEDGDIIRVTDIETEVVEVDCDTIEVIDGETILMEGEGEQVTVIEPDDRLVIVDDEATELVEDYIQGPPGPTGPEGGIAANQTDTLVLAGNTETIDMVLLGVKRSAKWFITATDNVNGLFAFSEVAAIHNDTTARWTHYAKIGDPLSYAIVVSIQGPQLTLVVTNNEAVSVEFSVVRVVTDIV